MAARRLTMTLGLVALGLVAPASAAAGWTPPRTIGSGPSYGQKIAVNRSGDAIVAWRGGRGITAAVARRGGRFGRPELIRGSDYEIVNDDLRVGIDERGNAAVAWTDCVENPASNDPDFDPEVHDECFGRIRAAVRPAGRRFGRTRKLGPAGSGIAVAVAGGHVAVAWIGEGGIRGAFATGRRWRGPSRLLVSEGSRAVPLYSPEVALRPDGSGWLAYDSGSSSFFRRALSRSGRAGRRRPVLKTPTGIGDSAMAIDPRGWLAALWSADELDTFGTWAPRPLRRGGARARHLRRGFPDGADVAVSTNGRAAGAFVNGSTAARVGLTTARGRSGLRRPLTVRGALTSSSPAVAVNNAGRVGVAWLDTKGKSFRAVTRTPEGRFTRPKRFRLRRAADPTCSQGEICDLPDVAVDGWGTTTVVWIDGRRVRYSRLVR